MCLVIKKILQEFNITLQRNNATHSKLILYLKNKITRWILLKKNQKNMYFFFFQGQHGLQSPSAVHIGGARLAEHACRGLPEPRPSPRASRRPRQSSRIRASQVGTFNSTQARKSFSSSSFSFSWNWRREKGSFYFSLIWQSSKLFLAPFFNERGVLFVKCTSL